MSDKKFRVTYTRLNSTAVMTRTVAASSASQAKEKIKQEYKGDVKIISAVEN